VLPPLLSFFETQSVHAAEELFPLELWRALGVGIATLSFLPFLWLVWTRHSARTEFRSVSKSEVVSVCLLLTLAAFLRFVDLEDLHGGRLTMDEAALTRTYVAGIVGLEPVFNGASYVTHALLLDAWYHVFGVSTYSARYFTFTIGLLGLVFFFASVRLLLGTRCALWSTAVLAVSAFAAFFSTFALEAVHVFVVLPVSAFLLIRWFVRPTRLRALAAGVTLGFGFFTYPGVILGLGALGCGWLLALVASGIRRRRLPDLGFVSASPWQSWCWFAVGLLVVLATGISLHATIYATQKALFAGGGDFGLSATGYLGALRVLAVDSFLGGKSWHMPFRSLPFFETTLWPWAILGAALIWNRRPSWAWRGAVLSIAITVFLVPLTGPDPGMRRGLYALLPFTALVGVSACAALDRLGRIFGLVLLGLALAHPLYYQLALGRAQATSGRFGASFGAAPVPDGFLLAQLERSDIVMSADEFSHERDRGRHTGFHKLAVRHGALDRTDHTLSFLKHDDPMLGSLLAEPGTAMITWKPCEFLSETAGAHALCYRFDSIAGDCRGSDEQLPFVLRFAALEEANRDFFCDWAELGSSSSRMKLGYQHRELRGEHEFECINAACGPTRPHFVFVHPGHVSFKLRRPYSEPGRLEPAFLELGVSFSGAVERRKNKVLVNGVVVGFLDHERVQEPATARFRLPERAWRDDEFWSVKITSADDPDKIGWDVREAVLELARDEPAHFEQCGILRARARDECSTIQEASAVVEEAR
jgi:hypothetical protein